LNTISKVQIQTNSRKGKDPSAQKSILSNVTEPEDNLLVFFSSNRIARARFVKHLPLKAKVKAKAKAKAEVKMRVKVRVKEKEEVIMTQMASASL